MTTTKQPPEQPPEGKLLEMLRGRHRPRLSMRRAAKLADMSDGRWRQIENGYQTVTAGQQIPVRAPAETLAHMVAALGGNPQNLRDAGRDDAAAELAEMVENIEDRPLPPEVGDTPERMAKRERIRQLRELADEMERELREASGG